MRNIRYEALKLLVRRKIADVIIPKPPTPPSVKKRRVVTSKVDANTGYFEEVGIREVDFEKFTNLVKSIQVV